MRVIGKHFYFFSLIMPMKGEFVDSFISRETRAYSEKQVEYWVARVYPKFYYGHGTDPVQFLVIYPFNRERHNFPAEISNISKEPVGCMAHVMWSYDPAKPPNVSTLSTFEDASTLYATYEEAALQIVRSMSYLPNLQLPGKVLDEYDMYLIPTDLLNEIPWAMPMRCYLIESFFSQERSKPLHLFKVFPPFPGKFLGSRKPIEFVYVECGGDGSLVKTLSAEHASATIYLSPDNKMENLILSELPILYDAKLVSGYEKAVITFLDVLKAQGLPTHGLVI